MKTNKENNNKLKCSRCNKKIHPLEIFPGGLCLKCYEEDFNKEVKKNKGKLPRPNFKGSINLK